MKKYQYGEIPDSYRSREYLLLCPHMFRCFRELGLNYIEGIYPKYQQMHHDATHYRLENMIYTSKDVIEGKISPEQAEKTIIYTLPHVMSVRADLQSGLLKLLFGDSVDISFLIFNDSDDELFHITNIHAESGIPVDWWMLDNNDELLERRHLKLGIKLKDIPKKVSYIQAAKLIRDVLLDVRNERTPQWADSMYSMTTINTSMMFNLFAELSNYEMFLTMWMGLNSKRVYKMRDQLFTLYPDPPLIGTLGFLPYSSWTSKMVGLASGRKLVLHQVESNVVAWIKREFPEAYLTVFLKQWEIGIPTPKMTLSCKISEDKNKLLDEKGNLLKAYPNNPRLMLEQLEIPEEEAFIGYLTDITDEESHEKFSRKNLLSKNMGRYTEFLG
ncbi:MAG TPA: hypothetical protein VMV49_18320 [Candidatus Deferrimicrobium sp.]|nr:hypothetical protein [Candidatus Deferrimicrobium sp.]